MSPPQSNAGVRRFAKPPESLERSLEMSRHRGRKKTQKRPNYKNVGEEDEEERGAEEGPDEEKAKGTESSSKASRTSGDTEGECPQMNVPPSLTDPLFSRVPPTAVELLSELALELHSDCRSEHCVSATSRVDVNPSLRL